MPNNDRTNRELATCLPTTLQDSTRRQYVCILRNLWMRAVDRPEEDLWTWDWSMPDDEEAWHGNWVWMFLPKIVTFLEQQQFETTTLRNYWNVVHICLRADQEKQALTSNIIGQLNRLIVIDEGEQRQDSKEKEWAMTHDALLEVLDDLHDKVRWLPAYCENRAMTWQEIQDGGYETLFGWLALACYVLQPPLRGEWGNMLLLKDTHQTQFDVNNYYFEEEGAVQINRDKVSSHSGGAFVCLSGALKRCIDVSLRLYPDREFVIPSKRYKDKHHTYFPVFLRSIRDPKSDKIMNQGIQMLRSSYITWFYDNNPTLNEKRKLAYAMRHSWQVAEGSYRKIMDS